MFSERVLAGHYDNHLIISGDNPTTPALMMLDRLEEEWTPKDVLARSKDWVAVKEQTPLHIDLDGIWRFFQYAYRFRGPVRNVITNLVMLTGVPALKFNSPADEKEWDRTKRSDGNRFPIQWRAIEAATYLFGDYFTTVYPQEGGRGARVRNLEPYQISEVVTEDGDPAIVTAYKRLDQSEDLKADDTVHHLLDPIGNELRGVPLLTGALRPLAYLYKWEEDLYYLGHIRARFPVVREVAGGSAAVAAEANRVEYLPQPGRMLVQNKGFGMHYPPAYQGLGGALEGWEIFAKSIAMTANLPYFLVTQDYRENSLASSLSADSPTTKWIMANRAVFEFDFQRIIGLAINEPDVDVEFTWPAVIERDKEKLGKVYVMAIQAGAASAQDMCEDVLGKDWEETQKRIDSEADKDAERWKMPQGPKPGVTDGNP